MNYQKYVTDLEKRAKALEQENLHLKKVMKRLWLATAHWLRFDENQEDGWVEILQEITVAVTEAQDLTKDIEL